MLSIGSLPRGRSRLPTPRAAPRSTSSTVAALAAPARPRAASAASAAAACARFPWATNPVSASPAAAPAPYPPRPPCRHFLSSSNTSCILYRLFFFCVFFLWRRSHLAAWACRVLPYAALRLPCVRAEFKGCYNDSIIINHGQVCLNVFVHRCMTVKDPSLNGAPPPPPLPAVCEKSNTQVTQHVLNVCRLNATGAGDGGLVPPRTRESVPLAPCIPLSLRLNPAPPLLAVPASFLNSFQMLACEHLVT
jgi:hypothetical protein